jgi:MerR family copper efflux transcriptional regulator
VSGYRISQLAERTGAPATTVRYHEREDLLPAARTAAGYRVYTDADVDRVGFICATQHLGLPLDRVRGGDALREPAAGGGATVRLPADRAGELADPAVAEQECCRFVGFEMAFDGPRVALTARAPGAAEVLVQDLFDHR